MSDKEAFHLQALEAEIADLVASGILRGRIEIEHRANLKSIVKVDGKPVAAFSEGFLDSSALPAPKPGDRLRTKP
ncbi:hypothetical protein [Mesorhizobium sp. B2-3-8]|nr:hypothetical protein [Mesorhizobium sp. B2-3-8]TPM06794.1 hypothetical protein FJ939_12075 [Mesorhizobium sp. B2-3-8]